MNELISIIVPIYNVEKYVEKCINSITRQTYKNLEIILVNDGATDNSKLICETLAKKDKRIKLINKENGGLSDARNVGIDNANGKYISFIDSDDYVEENYVELLYNTMKQYDTNMSRASHKVKYEKNIIDKSTGKKFCDRPKQILEMLLYDDGIDTSAWGKLYKSKLFKDIQFPKGRLFEDSATTYKLIDKSEKIAVYSKPVYNYIIRNNSISNEKFSEKKLDLITSTKEMTEYIKIKYPELTKACNRRLMYAYLSTLTQLAKSKVKNKKIQKELMGYICKNRSEVLKDKNTPKRDRIGLISTIFGFHCFKYIWKIYSIFTGRSNKSKVENN